MRVGLSAVAALLTMAPLIGPSPDAAAAPITISRPFLQIDNIAPNSIGATTGMRLRLGADSVVPNGLATPPTTGVATTTNLSTGATVSQTLNFSPSTVSPDFYFRSVADTPALRGPWTYTFTNGADSSAVTVSLPAGAQHLATVQSLAVSGSTLNPTFTWSPPASGQIDGYRINLYDRARPALAGGFDNVLSRNITATSFTVPTALAGGLSLDPSHPYTIEINAFSTRDGTTNLGNPNVFARSRAFFDFRPVAGGFSSVFLPVLTPGGSFAFTVPVIADDLVFIDPEIAVGYDYAVGSGDPNFRSVLLPLGIGDGLYDLYGFDTGGAATLLLSDLAGGVEYDFGAAGVSRFRVLGIETEAGLDPVDTTAFITGLRFTADGTFTGTMTPITVTVPDASPVPAPGTLILLAGALLVRARVRTCGI